MFPGGAREQETSGVSILLAFRGKLHSFQGSALEREAGVAPPHADYGQEAGASITVCPQAEPGNKRQVG
ncbi:hypothetical protein CKO51_11620 [Rhodopirellula sp. SM50]|nr:hypothetical protein CKO51_11620 [Rhodopirellula sp. SM50]